MPGDRVACPCRQQTAVPSRPEVGPSGPRRCRAANGAGRGMTTQRNRSGNGGPVRCPTRECEPGLEHYFRGLTRRSERVRQLWPVPRLCVSGRSPEPDPLGLTPRRPPGLRRRSLRVGAGGVDRRHLDGHRHHRGRCRRPRPAQPAGAKQGRHPLERLAIAAALVAALRAEGKAVLLHCVQALSRTPCVAGLYGARLTGRTPTEALVDVWHALPQADSNSGSQAARDRLG